MDYLEETDQSVIRKYLGGAFSLCVIIVHEHNSLIEGI